MSTIMWLGEEACHLDELVGGKAAALSRFAATYAVPAGFAVPALSPHAPAIAVDVAEAIASAYHALAHRRAKPDVPVAVRSSAIDEDGCDASFAGQHDTYLNIRGYESVVDAVHRCAQSAASREALAYRAERGLAADDVRIAVLVQELVQSEVSGVAFSANPITGGRDEVMINASWGLGESIVGGSVTPDTFVVAKRGPEVTSRDIAQKDRMTVLLESGTCEVAVPDELQSVSSMSDDQAVQVARLATSLEESAGHPVDIEFAIAEGTLYLLQCRPITTLG